LAKFHQFSGDEPTTEKVECDGLYKHSWKVLTADRGIGTAVSGLCWCETCGALGRWNNLRHGAQESVTEITLTTNNPHEF